MCKSLRRFLDSKIEWLAGMWAFKRAYWAISLPILGGVTILLGIRVGRYYALSVAWVLFVLATWLREATRSFSYDFALMETLNKVATAVTVEHSYPEYRIIYTISGDRGDKWLRKFKIDAKKPMVAVKQVFFGAMGPGIGTAKSFDALQIKAWTSDGVAVVFPGEDTDGKWIGNLVCAIPIEPHQLGREFSIKGVWKDLWAPLRAQGVDHGAFALAKPCAHFEIVITFPDGIKHADLIRGQLVGDVSTAHDTSGRFQLIWTVKNAKPDRYTYDIVCKELPGLVGKRKKHFFSRKP